MALMVKPVKLSAPNPDARFNGNGWGITNGKGWYFHAYYKEEDAKTVAARIGNDPKVIAVNVAYPYPTDLRNIGG